VLFIYRCYLVILTAMGGVVMQPITFKLCRHDTDENWSVDIDGKVHYHAFKRDSSSGLGEYAAVGEQHPNLKHEAPTEIGQQQSSA
jgi:hypothetical protein